MRKSGHDGAVRLGSIAVLIVLVAAGAVLLRNATYSGVTFGSEGSGTPSTSSSASAAAMAKACSDLANLQLLRVDLMTRTIASLRTERTALVNASDHPDASKVQAVIAAAVNLVSALKNGSDTTAPEFALVQAEHAVPCG